MNRKVVFEPSILGLSTFAIYLGGPVVFYTMSVLAGCKAKGFCNAPLGEFILIVIAHWGIVGLVLKRNLLVARWLLVAFGTLPFLALTYFGLKNTNVVSSIFWVVETYLFLIGVLFTGYVWLSTAVSEYIEYLKS